MKLRTATLSVALAAVLLGCTSQTQNDYSEQVEALLQQMTLEEKIGQLNQLDAGGGALQYSEDVKAGRTGSLLNCPPSEVNNIQRIAVEESRLHIPLLLARDVIHGYKTVFPIPLGQACSWDTAVVKEGARIASEEATAAGIRYTFAPMIDVTRDPRWGRVAESLGEDALLTSVLGAAMIRGFQGDDLSQANRMAACAKHFAAYGLTEAGRDYNVVYVSEQKLRDYVLPPFEAAAKAGVATFMAGFNELNGVPVSGNTHLLRDILRNEWQYNGMVISDYFSIEQMAIEGYCQTKGQSAEIAINAGVDMDMMSKVYIAHLDSLVKAGAVKEATIDDAVRNVLRLKYRLGLFDNPYTDFSRRDSVTYAASHLQAAKQAAIESAVLVKNDHQTLPLSLDKCRSIAVIGPMADAPYEQMGTWCFDGDKTHSVTPLTAIRQLVGDKVNVLYAPGLKYSRDNSQAEFGAAVSAARKADVVLLFVGEEAILSGEGKCRADLNLPGAQQALVEAVKATGKPLVCIFMAGRPLTIGKELEASDAAFIAFHGGTMAGPALADLLFGLAEPQGKLPITFPRMTGQIPIYYNDYITGRPGKGYTMLNDIPVEAPQTSLGFCTYWLETGLTPLLPFGYGKTYTQFEYGKIRLTSDTIDFNRPLEAVCTLKNTGTRDGVEIVQLYVQDLVGSLVRPVKELKGFQRIALKAGESTEVRFEIGAHDLSFWNADCKHICEPGDFKVWIAPNSVEGEPATFYLTH